MVRNGFRPPTVVHGQGGGCQKTADSNKLSQEMPSGWGSLLSESWQKLAHATLEAAQGAAEANSQLFEGRYCVPLGVPQPHIIWGVQRVCCVWILSLSIYLSIHLSIAICMLGSTLVKNRLRLLSPCFLGDGWGRDDVSVLPERKRMKLPLPEPASV